MKVMMMKRLLPVNPKNARHLPVPDIVQECVENKVAGTVVISAGR